MRKILILPIFILLFSGITVAHGSERLPYHRTENLTFPAENLHKLHISNVNGKIEIRGGDQQDIRVQADISTARESDLERVKIEQHEKNGTLYIDVKLPKSRSFFFFTRSHKARVDFKVTVPRQLAVHADTVNGDVMIADINEEVDADTVNGSIKVENIQGKMKLDTVNGKISANHVIACLNIDMVNGKGTIENLKDGSCNSVQISTVNGDIKLNVSPDLLDTVRLETINGTLEVDFPVKMKGSRRSKLLTVGRGPVTIKADTVNGDLSLYSST